MTKELISEVLDLRVYTFNVMEDYLQYNHSYQNELYTDNDINIYEFAFKCKRWAEKKGWNIDTIHQDGGTLGRWLKCEPIGPNDPYGDYVEFIEADEVELIFTVCEWIVAGAEGYYE